MWSRIHLIPLLQAEEDRDLVRRHLADQAREKELLGENFKVYNSDRYVQLLLSSYPLAHEFSDPRAPLDVEGAADNECSSDM